MPSSCLRGTPRGFSFIFGVLIAGACVTRYPPVDPSDGPDTKDPPIELDEDQSPFCRNMKVFTSELREANQGVRCVSMDYSEAGTFGYDSDPTQSSFRAACFAGSDRYESMIVRPDKQIGGVRTAVQASLRVDGTGVVDLGEYGLSPAKFKFHDYQGPLAGEISIAYQDVAVRSVQDLGYHLPRIASNQGTPIQVRDSIKECMTQLCTEEAVFTEDIYSARPEVHITLKRGSASRLRPIQANAKVQIVRSGPASFTIRPLDRIDVAAKVRRSRDVMVAQRACGNVPVDPPGGCLATSSGFAARYQGCELAGRTLTCKLTLTSERKDRAIDLYVSSGNDKLTHIVDDEGAYHVALRGSIANLENRRFVTTQLVANRSTPVILEFELEQTPTSNMSLSLLDIRLGTQEGMVKLEWRDLSLSARSCSGRN